METVRIDNDFAGWRAAARGLLRRRCSPDTVFWDDGTGGVLDWAGEARRNDASVGPVAASSPVNVPPSFVTLAGRVWPHRNPQKCALLYRVLWRIVAGGERGLMDNQVDDEVRRLHAMAREVGHDIHRMHAFVRFRKVVERGVEHYIAWHRPDHRIVRAAAPFFAGRFASMRWSILTPDESAMWNGSSLSFGPGVDRSAAPADDVLESLWRTYYANIFNPARFNAKALDRHVPRRYRDCLPEMRGVRELVEAAPGRVEAMMRSKGGVGGRAGETSAAAWLPAGERSLGAWGGAAVKCRGCELHCHATQTVFGAGPGDAKVMFIGEQPGDHEDRTGTPFVGPAGRLLDEALAEAGIERAEVYLTNAVKHFKFEPRGERRIHSRPSAGEIRACLPWLEAEVAALRPERIICLGSTAARAMWGPGFRVTQRRGEIIEHPWAKWAMATYHPSALLRTPDEARRKAMRAEFVGDLRKVMR